MAIIFEDSAKVTKKQIPIPQNAKNVFKAMKKIYEPYLDKNIPGSKILKSLGSDKKYNKKGANAQTNGKEIKQDSVNVNDAKVRLHRMNKLPKNSIQYQLNGGELAANIYRKGIERARGTKEVEAVKPPKPTTNADLKPADTKSETIKTPSGKITYTVTAENKQRKKIYLSEQAINRLLEYYTQLKLPFNDTTSKGYDDKYNYEHFIDWMEYYGKYGMLPNSNVDESQLMEIINKNKQEAFKLYLDNDIEDSNYLYALSNSLSQLYSRCEDGDDLRVYFALLEEMYENPPMDVQDLMDLCDLNIEDVDDIEKILTDEGKEAFKQNMFEFFEDEYTSNGIPRELTINERGLIYIEREITVPNVLSTEMPDNTISRSSSIDTANNNYFELLRNNFVGLGSCWTWRKGKGEAYCGNFYRNGNLILLQGWVDPKDVNWEETIYRNAYSLSEEKELFINSGKMVEIDKVVVNDNIGDNYGKNILNKPILIET